MLPYRILIVVLALFLAPSMAVARGGGGHGGGHGGSHSGGHSGGHGGGHHSPSSPHSDSHPSGGLHNRGPGSVHSHSDVAPRAIGPKASAPSVGHHDSKPKPESPSKSQVTSTKPPASKCTSCPRDAHGKIQRSEVAKHDFMKQSGYPHGRHGYVVDHITPLAKGGKDVPSNMQWQTLAEARAKDKVERK